MILIVTEADDVHADIVQEKLERRKAALVRFAPSLFPREATGAIRYAPRRLSGNRLSIRGTSIDLRAVRAIWFRRGAPPTAGAGIEDPTSRSYMSEENGQFLNALWGAAGCRFVPGPRHVIKQADDKARQLDLAASLGFTIPATLISNDPGEVLRFYEEHDGQVISKLPSAIFGKHFQGKWIRYTRSMTRRDLGYIHAVRHSPAIFQAKVPKRLELRVTVAGKRVFAAAIASQASHHTKEDWRQYDFSTTPYEAYELPSEIGASCARLVERLGLCYGAIDLILTPAGEYVFIEINPNGQYQWIEDLTGLPISDAVVDLLLETPEEGAPS